MRPRLGMLFEIDHDVNVLQGYITMRALLEFLSFPKTIVISCLRDLPPP